MYLLPKGPVPLLPPAASEASFLLRLRNSTFHPRRKSCALANAPACKPSATSSLSGRRGFSQSSQPVLSSLILLEAQLQSAGLCYPKPITPEVEVSL